MKPASAKPIFHRRPMVLAIATLFTSLPATLVFAQEAAEVAEEASPAEQEESVAPPEEGADGIQEIFVTATRRDETVQDIHRQCRTGAHALVPVFSRSLEAL